MLNQRLAAQPGERLAFEAPRREARGNYAKDRLWQRLSLSTTGRALLGKSSGGKKFSNRQISRHGRGVSRRQLPCEGPCKPGSAVLVAVLAGYDVGRGRAVEFLGVVEVNNQNRAREPYLAGLRLGIGSGACWTRDLRVNSPDR